MTVRRAKAKHRTHLSAKINTTCEHVLLIVVVGGCRGPPDCEEIQREKKKKASASINDYDVRKKSNIASFFSNSIKTERAKKYKKKAERK